MKAEGWVAVLNTEVFTDDARLPLLVPVHGDAQDFALEVLDTAARLGRLEDIDAYPVNAADPGALRVLARLGVFAERTRDPGEGDAEDLSDVDAWSDAQVRAYVDTLRVSEPWPARRAALEALFLVDETGTLYEDDDESAEALRRPHGYTWWTVEDPAGRSARVFAVEEVDAVRAARTALSAWEGLPPLRVVRRETLHVQDVPRGRARH